RCFITSPGGSPSPATEETFGSILNSARASSHRKFLPGRASFLFPGVSLSNGERDAGASQRLPGRRPGRDGEAYRTCCGKTLCLGAVLPTDWDCTLAFASGSHSTRHQLFPNRNARRRSPGVSIMCDIG